MQAFVMWDKTFDWLLTCRLWQLYEEQKEEEKREKQKLGGGKKEWGRWNSFWSRRLINVKYAAAGCYTFLVV